MKKGSYFVYVFLLLGLPIMLFAQKDSTAQIQLNKGHELLFNSNYTEASKVFEEALTIATNTDDTSKIAAAYNGLSMTSKRKSDLRSAFEYAQKALEYSRKGKEQNTREEASALENLSIVQSFIGDVETSLKNSTAALEIRLTYFKDEKLALARSYFYNSISLHGIRKIPEALKKLDIALQIQTPETPQSIILHADIYQTKGHIFYDLGKNNQALTLFEKTLQLAQKAHDTNNPYFGNVYNDIGLIHSINGHYHESIKYYKKALSISIHNYGIDNHDQQVRIHFNIGTSYHFLDIKDKALFHTNKTLELGTKFYGPNHPSMHYPYSQLGNIYGGEKGIPYLEKSLEICLNSPQINYVITSFQYQYLAVLHKEIEDYEAAQTYFQKALDIRLKIHGRQNVNTIRSLNNIAKIHLLKKEFQKANIFNERALKNNQLTNTNSSNHLPSTNYVNSDLLLETLKTKADIFLAQFEETHEKKYLKESIRYYREAASFIDLARKSKRNHEDKMKFSETIKAIYIKNTETALLLDELENSTSSLENSFYASEKSKAHTLRELLQQAELKRNSNIQPTMSDLEQTVNTEIAILQSEILEEVSKGNSDSLKIYELEGRVFDLNKRKDSLEKHIEIAFPKYYKLKYQNTAIEVSTIQEKLNNNTTLIEFFKEKNTVYIFTITKQSFHTERVQIDNVDSKITDLNTAIIHKDQVQFRKHASNLYQELIAPVKKHIVGDELIIIPDESLWRIPFDLLLTETSKNEEKPAYLLYEYAISYTNSASLFFDESENIQTSNFKNECAAFSFTSTDTLQKNNNTIRLEELRNSQIDLPGTREEIQKISTILDGTYFYGNAANEMNFKKYANTSRVLHLALHGDIDNNNPDNLKIYFSEGSTTEDDILFSHELYSMHIPANLVVLSACNTGNGKVNRAEGIQSLGNAFQYAGAKSLLLSSWEISDKTTPEIMRQFYKNIKEGMPKHKALQQAKIDFLQNADTFDAAPFYWGSFYLLGNTQPIQFETYNYTYWLIGISIFLLLLFFILKKKRR
ncbi:CHAT domain-containing protein [uncultured Kordia sp.]|uniref:CHAT domain-containing protein n=1 Tax=uncultured Kordia sp. TaxID=507699 RepID=UPI002636EBEC|nr:CHAT domain-containing protein [uncultured Kordia sp.]